MIFMKFARFLQYRKIELLNTILLTRRISSKKVAIWLLIDLLIKWFTYPISSTRIIKIVNEHLHKILSKCILSNRVFYFNKSLNLIYLVPDLEALNVLSPYFELENMREVLNQVKNKHKGLFIDVGAHIGKYCLLMAKAKPSWQVVCVEPAKLNYHVLKYNVVLNRMRNIVLLNVALSDTRGEVSLYLSEYSGRHTIKRPIKHVSVQRVRTLTLDDIVRTYGCPDIIKIDVEGAEVDVLKGGIECLDKCSPAILIEFRKDTYYALKHLLTKFSYMCFKTQSDYMFCHKSLD